MSETFTVFSWNTQGSSQIEKKFRQIAPHIDAEPADIVCLQEFKDADRKLSELKNFKGYVRIIPPDARNHNAILSCFPVLHSEELPFPLYNSARLEPALWSDISVNGKTVRIYNCHFEITGIGIRGRLQQLRHVLTHAASLTGPVIVCGDMNTTIPAAGWRRKLVEFFHHEPEDEMTAENELIRDDERVIFSKTAREFGYMEAFPLEHATWSIFYTSWEFLNLKLDWFLTKGLAIEGAELGGYITDHRPMLVRCAI